MIKLLRFLSQIEKYNAPFVFHHRTNLVILLVEVNWGNFIQVLLPLE